MRQRRTAGKLRRRVHPAAAVGYRQRFAAIGAESGKIAGTPRRTRRAQVKAIGSQTIVWEDRSNVVSRMQCSKERLDCREILP